MAALDVFQYFSKSADKLPGRGAGESADPSHYPELAATPNWRRILSNFYCGSVPFEFDGLRYRSVEHAYQATKFRLCGHGEVANRFALESGSDLSRGDGLAARRARKLVVMTEIQLAPWTRMDTTAIRTRMYMAKFSQVPEARAVLLATRNARLVHKGGRIAAVEIAEIYTVRATLLAAR